MQIYELGAALTEYRPTIATKGRQANDTGFKTMLDFLMNGSIDRWRIILFEWQLWVQCTYEQIGWGVQQLRQKDSRMKKSFQKYERKEWVKGCLVNSKYRILKCFKL